MTKGNKDNPRTQCYAKTGSGHRCRNASVDAGYCLLHYNISVVRNVPDFIENPYTGKWVEE